VIRLAEGNPAAGLQPLSPLAVPLMLSLTGDEAVEWGGAQDRSG
jgi:hypothetical protein